MTKNILDLLQMKFPIAGNFDLICMTENITFSSVLDVGLGNGGASIYFAYQGKNVSALGVDISSYDLPQDLLAHMGIDVYESDIESFESNQKFDAIWASHILEHTLNPGSVLSKFRELLDDNGWLFLMVPPYKSQLVGGHVSTGWNMGQLMYNLLLTGFDIKNGHFIKHGYNICAFVQKSVEQLPKLRMDIGDIEQTQHLWPIEVHQGFEGNIESINWFENFIIHVDSREIKKQLEQAQSAFVKLEAEKKECSKKMEDYINQIDTKNKAFAELVELYKKGMQ